MIQYSIGAQLHTYGFVEINLAYRELR